MCLTTIIGSNYQYKKLCCMCTEFHFLKDKSASSNVDKH